MPTTKLPNEVARPIYWLNHANDLHAAAAALWFSVPRERSDEIVREMRLGPGFRLEAAVGGVFLMLCGLALEVLYKAVCVSKAKPVDQRHHRLVDHARGAGVAISKKEEKLLEILTEYVYWSGKYPVPKEPQSAARLRRLSRDHLFDSELIGSLKIHRPNGALNWASFEELWKNAAQEYVETNSA